METISLVMTSYNGDKYIEEQLQSILDQTRCPDEVLVFDDVSTDHTVSIIKNFIERNNLKTWHLVENEKNLGWKLNFFEAIKRVTGDIIFFSDQDDIWMPDKIEKMVKYMKEKEAGCVYGECIIIDENGLIKEERMLKTKWTDWCEQISFSKKFNTVVTLGCRMCISKKVADIYIALNDPNSGHDSQCGRISLLFSTVWKMDTPIIKYRIHSNNSSGIDSKVSFGRSNLEKRIIDIENNIVWLNKIISSGLISENSRMSVVENTLKFQEKRLLYLKGNKQIGIFKLYRYIEFYSGYSMWIGDFAYRHCINTLLGSIRWRICKVRKKND